MKVAQNSVNEQQAALVGLAPQPTTSPALFPALLNATEAARYLNLGRTAFYAAHRQGHIPQPVYVGTVQRWSRSELDAWIFYGCPPRQRWQTMKEQKAK